MARQSISLALLYLSVAPAAAQAFGRFGYSESIDVPGFYVERKGFKVRQDQADWFSYEVPSKTWKPLLTEDQGQTVQLSGVGLSPEKARFDLLAPGFSLYFRHGIGFRLTSLQAPYLSWDEGSVGPGVPTPSLHWLLVSFRDAQPPLLLAVQGAKEAFQITGKSGDWRLRSASPYMGWVRVTAPLGLRPMATNTAASLGALTVQVGPLLKFLVDPVPRLLQTEYADEPTAVTVTWTFDRPYAVAPLPIVLGSLGGYPIKPETTLTRIDSSDPSGPVSVSNEAMLRVRFPVRRIPTGRSIALGAPRQEPPGTVSPIDVPSVAELAFANLPACRDQLTKETAEETLAHYLDEAKYSVEPYSNQQLPYAPDGAGIDLAAAHALLMQSTITTVKATSEPNSLLTSVIWRRDWKTWTVWTSNSELSRRAASLACLAAVLCPEPARRADAAMLEAGLATQEGLRVWQARNGYPVRQTFPRAPFEVLRRSFFFYPKKKEETESYVKSLLSEIRVYGEIAVSAGSKEGKVLLSWQADSLKPVTIILASAYPIEVAADSNLANCSAEDALGFTVLHCTPKERGSCYVSVKAPEWAPPLPAYAEAPRYSD